MKPLIETVKICFAIVWRATRDNWCGAKIHHWLLATGLLPLRNSGLDTGIRFVIVDFVRLFIKARFFGLVCVKFFGLVDFIRFARFFIFWFC